MLTALQRIQLIKQGLSFLPARMDTLESRQLLLATGYQESKFKYRRQVKGPAVSFFQFEKIGIKEVLQNAKTKNIAILACTTFGVDPMTKSVYEALKEERYDALAVIFARLNYWRKNGPLPKLGAQKEAWNYYDSTWAPGKPKPFVWPESYDEATKSLKLG